MRHLQLQALEGEGSMPAPPPQLKADGVAQALPEGQIPTVLVPARNRLYHRRHHHVFYRPRIRSRPPAQVSTYGNSVHDSPIVVVVPRNLDGSPDIYYRLARFKQCRRNCGRTSVSLIPWIIALFISRKQYFDVVTSRIIQHGALSYFQKLLRGIFIHFPLAQPALGRTSYV